MDSKAIYKLMVKKCPNTKRNKHYLKRYVRFIAACLEKNEELIYLNCFPKKEKALQCQKSIEK